MVENLLTHACMHTNMHTNIHTHTHTHARTHTHTRRDYNSLIYDIFRSIRLNV